MEEITALEIEVPERLAAFMKGTKQSVPLGKDYEGFRDFLVSSI